MFSTSHELVVRDAMVFHLVKPVEFKVYIIMAYSLSEVGKDFGLRDSEAPAMQNTTYNGIKTSKLSTFINNFAPWDQSLEGLEHLGMNVCFLCTKMHKLENLVSELEHERYAKKRKEALDEFVPVEEWKRLDAVLLSLKKRAETHMQKFQEEVNAPW
ncbi:hypothetical protein GIB67_039972 [Kingdonia uniflora]|uniref:Uncharacterized protein n=1 Tax=Kingdonia uniflora TaxID=39325 RepID=A0A7J7P3L4_9MAGN|nr:hypothetical protein GIB67_039972 [Kingdonia uniflora]